MKIFNKTNKISTPPCFTGIVWTITSLFELYKSEKIEFQSETKIFIMTNRLTQDVLENCFSIMRQKKKNGFVTNIKLLHYLYNTIVTILIPSILI